MSPFPVSSAPRPTARPLRLALGTLLAAIALWACPQPATAQVRGEDLKVSVVTFGPHEHPFFKFGHNAILIEHSGGQGAVYNFGMFDFSAPALIPKFALGRSMYWLARTPRDATLRAYAEDNRTVELQELDLTPEQRKTVLERLEENARPQNRYYLYDYFFDNCSTRVRDVVDAAVGGRLRTAASAPARLSFRGHALRLTADLPWEYVALAFGLGTTADRPITRFEEGFIPMELRDTLREVKIPVQAGAGGGAGAGGAGASKPLVKSERVVFKAIRTDPPHDPPRRAPVFALVGVLLGALLAALGWVSVSQRWVRLLWASTLAIVGLVAGLLGLLLVFLWAATNHRAAHGNANMLQAVPFALVFPFYVRGLFQRRPRTLQRALWLAAGAAAVSLLGYLLKLVGLIDQENTAFVVLFLPLWIGAAAGLWRVDRSVRVSAPLPPGAGSPR